ncbi:MAG: patatin-like phospholipase family protein [Cytophagales bacterium]|nr:patatin-like phospholipase family protein [Cytophagales bacterium]
MNYSLSLSGGGFRASAYSHGAFLLLQELDLLKNVHILSSVSGGSITASMYSIYGDEFSEFSKRLDDVHQKDQLIRRAYDVIENHEIKVPSQRENIITAFAEVYDQDLFERTTFGALWTDRKPDHLKDVIINSTEFKNGTCFRFQYGGGRNGNKHFTIPRKLAKQIRMADILAASSCFPGAFEPLSLPKDFRMDKEVSQQISDKIELRTSRQAHKIPPGHPEAQKLATALQEEEKANSNKTGQKKENPPSRQVDELALMDGGIYDNQGIESVLLANKRDREDKTDMMIIVDVSSSNNNIYDPPVYKPGKKPSIQLNWLIGLVVAGLSAFLWLPAISFFKLTALIDLNTLPIQEREGLAFVWNWSLAYVIGLSVLTVLFLLGLNFFLKTLRQLKKQYPSAITYGLKTLGSRRLKPFSDMVNGRISSLFAINTEIFLSRAREQVYEDALESPELRGKVVPAILDRFHLFETARKPNFLTGMANRLPPEAILDPEDPNHMQIVRICNRAGEMPTTLWFENNTDKKPKLVAAGYIILCHALIEHFYKISKKQERLNSDDQAIYDRLLNLWKSIIDDPYALARKHEVAM